MPRYKLTIEYDGSDFVGWQRQVNGPSIQAAVEAAIQRFCGAAVGIGAAGRTDAGVHALGQVAHADIAGKYPPTVVRDAINFHLRPQPIAVVAAEIAPAGFDARFSATARVYRYCIVNRVAPPTIARRRAWHVATRLNAAAMRRAAQGLVGHHDFTTFRSSACQALSPVRTLAHIGVARRGETIVITARARSFLHHQVRSMVGSLERVGAGKWPEAEILDALAARDRRRAGPTAPACGLYLVEVEYGA
jgi:tRNA pseudouridine38-40 synthase